MLKRKTTLWGYGGRILGLNPRRPQGGFIREMVTRIIWLVLLFYTYEHRSEQFEFTKNIFIRTLQNEGALYDTYVRLERRHSLSSSATFNKLSPAVHLVRQCHIVECVPDLPFTLLRQGFFSPFGEQGQWHANWEFRCIFLKIEIFFIKLCDVQMCIK